MTVQAAAGAVRYSAPQSDSTAHGAVLTLVLACLCCSRLCAGLRAIDLLSQMLGPVVSGLLMSYSSMLTAIVVLAVYSLAAWVLEALLLQAAHRHSPRLR